VGKKEVRNGFRREALCNRPPCGLRASFATMILTGFADSAFRMCLWALTSFCATREIVRANRVDLCCWSYQRYVHPRCKQQPIRGAGLMAFRLASTLKALCGHVDYPSLPIFS